jgi:hypothetical protein
VAELLRIEPSLFRPSEEAWFVMDDGRKYLRKLDREASPARSSFPSPAIRRDSIAPTRGPDMRIHDSLSSYRRSLKAENNPQHENYIELGNEGLKHAPKQFDERTRRDNIRQAMADVKNGNVPPPVALED